MGCATGLLEQRDSFDSIHALHAYRLGPSQFRHVRKEPDYIALRLTAVHKKFGQLFGASSRKAIVNWPRIATGAHLNLLLVTQEQPGYTADHMEERTNGCS